MENTYFAIVTDLGTKKMFEALNEEKKVSIAEFAVGDGGGTAYLPTKEMEELKNEVWRGSVKSCYVSEESENLLITESVIPSDVGGFTIREMGIYDTEGTLIAICNTPETQKVKIADGVVHEMVLSMEIALSNTDSVELIVDPAVVTATKKDVERLEKRLEKKIEEEDNATYRQATGYTDTKIAELINGAPSTLDTLGEIAQAMQDNENVVEALEAAMGNKAPQAEVDGHTSNSTIHITASERTNWNSHMLEKATANSFGHVKLSDTFQNALADGDAANGVGASQKALADAYSALNSNLADSLGGLTFGVDSDGNPGYIKAGADTVTPFKSGVSFVWQVYGLSGSINLKNTGKVKLTILNFLANGGVNVYGATSPTELYHNAYYNLHLYGTFAINSGQVNIEQVVDTPDINTYPYIVIYPVYATGWSNNSSINICEITT